MAITRADKHTFESKKRETYSDFLNNFDVNPFTGLLVRVTNEESVKQALKNLVLTQEGERFYDMNKGSRILHSLFELYDAGLLHIAKVQLEQSLQYYEPRAIIHDIRMAPDHLDSNAYTCQIVFSIRNIPGQNYNLNLAVNRVR